MTRLNSRILRFSAIAVSALLVAALTCSSAMAQQVSTGRTGTTTGSTSTGGMSGSGSTGIGGTTGTGTASSGIATSGVGSSGITTGPAGFVGANTNQEFVGAGRQAVTNSNTNRQFRAIQDTGAMRNTTQTQTGTPRQITVGLRVGFTAPSMASDAASLSAANAPSFDQYLATRSELAGLQVQVSADGIARISGSTNSLSTSRLAANLIRLQPGIRSVDNQLVVVESNPD